MVYIITKNDGPRKEDVAAKKFIESNRATIDRLANHLSGGRWQDIKRARKARAPVVESARKSFAGYAPAGRSTSTRPMFASARTTASSSSTRRPAVRCSSSVNSGQSAAGRYFRLATRENGFFDPLDDDLRGLLSNLDGLVLPEETEERFKH